MEKQIEISEDNVGANARTADTAVAEGENAAADLGKFKSVDALLDAYRKLEAEFTRRSQRLKELEDGNKAGPDGGVPSRTQEVSVRPEEALTEEVRRAVIEDYLKEVSAGKSVPLISGGFCAPAPKAAPKTVREAGELARRFLK